MLNLLSQPYGLSPLSLALDLSDNQENKSGAEFREAENKQLGTFLKVMEGDTDIHNIDLVVENEAEICEITSTSNISNQHGQGSIDINIKGDKAGNTEGTEVIEVQRNRHKKKILTFLKKIFRTDYL